jgi:signal transduction histidine kinase
MEQLFEPLFTTKARGIGLGLALSQGLVHANRGTIHAESVPGEGTTFTLTLPTAETQ